MTSIGPEPHGTTPASSTRPVDAERYSLVALCHACAAEPVQVVLLVDEGLLEVSGDGPDRWSFDSAALQRTRLAVRLWRDLELDLQGLAVVLGLLDQVQALRSQLRRAGVG